MRCRKITFALYAALAFAIGAATAADQPVQKITLPGTEAQCLAAGGEWIPLGPQMVTHGCMLKTGDGNKSCKTSAQCQGECIEHSDGNRCAAYVDGCYRPTGRGTVTQCVN
jgi:hypothetical protein